MVHSVSKANEQQLEFMQRSSSASTIGVFALFQRLMGHVTSNLNMQRLHHRQSTALNHFFDPTLRSEAVHRHTHLPTYLPTPHRHGLSSVRPPKAFISPIKKTPQQDRPDEENASTVVVVKTLHN